MRRRPAALRLGGSVGQQRAVRRQAQLRGVVQGRQFGDQCLQVPPGHGLAAGQTDLFHAESDEQAHQPGDFFKG